MKNTLNVIKHNFSILFSTKTRGWFFFLCLAYNPNNIKKYEIKLNKKQYTDYAFLPVFTITSDVNKEKIIFTAKQPNVELYYDESSDSFDKTTYLNANSQYWLLEETTNEKHVF